MKTVKIMSLIIIMVLTVGQLSAFADSLLSESEGLCDMFGSHVAARVGDVITIILAEETTSNQTAKGKLKNTYTKGADEGKGWLEQIFAGLGMSGGETKNVESTTTQEHQLDAVMSATVVEVLPNGQLRIEGVKSMEVNHETQKLTVTGVIRKRDVTPDNTITSNKIANLKARVNGLPIERSLRKKDGGIITWIWDLLF